MMTSPPNTDLEPQNNLPVQTGRSVARGAEPSATDLQVLDLQDKLVASEDSKKQERWYWITAVAFFADCALFPHMGVVAVTLLMMLEITVLVLLAKAYGVEDVMEVMSDVAKLIKSAKSKDEEE